jgi:hypothetical protein
MEDDLHIFENGMKDDIDIILNGRQPPKKNKKNKVDLYKF